MFNLTADEAFQHYKEGSGKPLRMSFSQIDTSSVLPSDFPNINVLINDRAPGIYIIDSKMPFTTKGDEYWLLGNITLRTQGSLFIDSDRTWAYFGNLKSYDDYYDFNASSHRSFIGEAATWFGAQHSGKPFDIEIRGSKSFSGSGG